MVKKVHDEERWARRVLYLGGTPPGAPGSMSDTEREIRDFNPVKLAAAPRAIGASAIVLFFESEKEAPRALYYRGVRKTLAKYRPKSRQAPRTSPPDEVPDT